MAGALRFFGKPPHLLSLEELDLLPESIAFVIYEAEQRAKEHNAMFGKA